MDEDVNMLVAGKEDAMIEDDAIMVEVVGNGTSVGDG